MKVDDITANIVNITANNVMKDLEILCVNSMISPPLPNTTPLITSVMDVLALKYQDLDSGLLTKIDPTFGLGSAISIEYSFKNPKTMVLIGQNYEFPLTDNRIVKTNDSGQTWQNINTQTQDCNNAPWGGNISVSATNINNMVWVPNFKSSFPNCLTDVKNQPRFTINGGQTWTYCNNINFNDGNFPFTFKSTFSIGKLLESDKVNGNKFYYYAMEGNTFIPKLYQSIDSGASWQVKSTSKLPVTGNGHLKANPFLENDIWFAPFNTYILNNDSNPESRKLFHSTDGGITFNSLTTIQEVYAFGFGMKKTGTNVASLIIYGKINNIESIFISYDLGQTFIDLGTNNIPEGLIVDIEGDMKVENRFYASTGCRGGWYGDIVNNINLKNISFDNEKVKIYPNPVKNYFKIDLLNFKSKILKIEIFDVLGQKVKSLEIEDNLLQIDIKNLKFGLYFVNISDNFETKTFKIIKQ